MSDRARIFGAWTSFADPSITELFAETGVDFIGIDIEHSTIDLEQSKRIIAAAHSGGSPCLPRVASHNGEQIARLLDAGADGVIVPKVSTPDEVDQIVKWVKYPPVGNRSYGISRAQSFGFHFDDYVSTWNDRSTLVIQIETVEGVRAVNDLLINPHVDGVLIGPYDLSGSMGIAGQLQHARVREACAQVADACRRRHKACGAHLVEPDGDSIREAFESGYTFVVLASDVFVLWKWGERMKALIRQLRQP